MMINSYANHGPPPRPSTSPVPNFFSSAAAGRKQQFRASQHLQNVVAEKAAAANSVRLRPLPPAGSSSGGGAFGSLMMIEGRTTGEEILRSTTERRELPPPPPTEAAAASPSSAAASGGSRVATPAGKVNAASSTDEAERLRTRVRKLEAELKKALDLNRRRVSDTSILQAQVDALQATLDTARNILSDAEKAHTVRLAAKQSECDDLKRAREALQKQLEDARKETDAHRTSQAASSDAKLTAAQEAWAQERSALQSALAEGKREGDAQRRRADLLQTQLDTTRSDLATSQRQAENERLARERSDAVNIARMAQLEREADEARSELAQWRERIRQVDAFVLEICQPQFSVVKDESLKPMEVSTRPGSSSRSSGEGFVLVPLQLLLQGYALLPKEKKQTIADRYEATKGVA